MFLKSCIIKRKSLKKLQSKDELNLQAHMTPTLVRHPYVV
jgi:hypothetical protein